jgi:hypothetical protein
MFTGLQVRKIDAFDSHPAGQVEGQEETKEEMKAINQQREIIKELMKKQIKAPIEADSLPEKENIITGVRF